MSSCAKKLAVIGTGRMGSIRMLASQIIPSIRFCGIIDCNLNSAEIFANMYDVPFSNTLESFIKKEGKPDAVWISTPTHTHLEIIEIASKHGIAVATEKPVAMDPATTLKCYSMCETFNVPLFCSFQRRTDVHYQDMYRKVVNDRTIGDLQSMHSIFRDHPIPGMEFLITGGDLFHDCGVHDIDFARTINEKCEVRSVFAVGHSFNHELRKNNVLDLTNALLMFENNVQYQIELSRTAQYGYDVRFEAFGSEGCVKVNNIQEKAVQLENNSGVHFSQYKYSFPQRFYHAFIDEVAVFADIINGKCESSNIVTCKDACRATQIAEACRLSIENKCIIDIAYDDANHARCEYQIREGTNKQMI